MNDPFPGFNSVSGEPTVLALDIGTSSCRAAVFDATGRALPGTAVQQPLVPLLGDGGRAEFAAGDLLAAVANVLDRLVATAPGAVAGVQAAGVSTFWHSLLGIDARGCALTPVYLWLDSRAAVDAAVLRRTHDERTVHARTGCVFHASYWPAKLRWLARTEPDLTRRVARWVSFGEYLGLRCFGQLLVSVSMASATGLLNQATRTWDPGVLVLAGVDPDLLAPIAAPDQAYLGLRPEYAARWPALAAIPWLPAAGDGACSNLGAGCATRDRFALMIGTSGALRALWRTRDVAIPWGVWGYRADHRRVVLGGALNDGGNLLDWARRTLRLPDPADLDAAIAARKPDGHGLTVLPFWGGERSPNWSAAARGAIAGLGLHTDAADIWRAILEAIAYRFLIVEDRLRRAVPDVREIVATGGALLRSPACLQILADVLGRPVLASAEAEASSRGAALLALEAAGRLPAPLEALPPPAGRRYDPVPERTARYREAAERQERFYATLIGPATTGGEG